MGVVSWCDGYDTGGFSWYDVSMAWGGFPVGVIGYDMGGVS